MERTTWSDRIERLDPERDCLEGGRGPLRRPATSACGCQDGRAYARQVICDACRESEHERCPGGSWCDCQHRLPGPVEPVTGPPGE